MINPTRLMLLCALSAMGCSASADLHTRPQQSLPEEQPTPHETQNPEDTDDAGVVILPDGGHTTRNDAGTPPTTPTDGGIPPDMVRVPAGVFNMGCNELEGHCWAEEEPVHPVYVSAFDIDRTEVSRSMYLQCLNAGACTAPVSGANLNNKPNEPVFDVTWYQATAFCAFKGKRLPTEAEWEKAARGLDGRLYPWGNSLPDCTRCNTLECGGALMPVDTLPAGASPYGAVNMCGNVWEWVSDWYAPYVGGPATDPQGPASGVEKVYRGGSFRSGLEEVARLSTARRFIDVPTGYKSNRGIRCAKSAP